MVSSKRTLLLALVGAAATAQVALAQAAGDAGLTPCATNADCATVFGAGVTCAPNGYCGDAGASCTSSQFCYDACGGGICGGVGASCNTVQLDNYSGFKCASGNTCTGSFSENGAVTGVCTAVDEPIPSARRHRRAQQLALTQRCPIGQELCGVSELLDQASCVNTQDNIEFCGGCISDGQGKDCSSIANSDQVACALGECSVVSCLEGWKVNEDATACV